MKTTITLLSIFALFWSNSIFSQITLASTVNNNIQFQVNPGGFFQDELNCMYFGNGQYIIQLNNTILNDSIFIVSNNYTVQDTIIDTTPTSGFSYVFNSVGGPGGNDFYQLSHDKNKIICNGDTLDISYNFYMDFQPPICTFSQIGGNVFIDNNNDCLSNAGDQGISLYVTTVANYSVGTKTTSNYSNFSGAFNETQFKSNTFLSASASIPSIYNFAFGIPSCATPILNFSSLPATNLDFPRTCLGDIDLSVHNYNTQNIRPNIPFSYFPQVSNIGCTAFSGTLQVVLDPLLIYDSVLSVNPADSQIGNTLFWNYSNLTNVNLGAGYWNSFVGGIHLTPDNSVNIGDILTIQLSTDMPGIDVDLSNNSSITYLEVVNSYDPNIKEVFPKGNGPEGYIPDTTEKLTYVIHFQNTGNAPALNISVLDTLPGNIVPNSFRLLSNSHLMNPQWLTNNIVQFNFPNINLVDSTSDEVNSHGYVSFEVELQNNLNPGTEIKNTGYIYFDNNPAIVTNTAISTIEFPSTASLNNNSLNNLDVSVAPNPMKDYTLFKINNSENLNYKLEIIDLTGKIIFSQDNINQSEYLFENSGLNSGVYIYQLSNLSVNMMKTGKLVVQ